MGKMAKMVLDIAKKQEKLTEKQAEKAKKKAHKWMKSLLEGKSHSDMWGAKLFAPRTRVMSDTSYKKYQAKLKSDKVKKLKKKKAAEATLLVAEKKKAKAHKAALAKKASARKLKEKNVEQAMLNVDKAKTKLAAAVASSPKAQGL